ncbi:MAG: hypothetical protein HGA19_04785 [Oscillochloris sp.]|nr:hypothetical protein [Oscillochloris sp.]
MAMHTAMVEQRVNDEEVVVPPLPIWLMPAVVVLTGLFGLVIWLLWTFSGPISSLIDPRWIFLCH